MIVLRWMGDYFQISDNIRARFNRRCTTVRKPYVSAQERGIDGPSEVPRHDHLVQQICHPPESQSYISTMLPQIRAFPSPPPMSKPSS